MRTFQTHPHLLEDVSMKILVLCGKTPSEWELEFGRLLGQELRALRCTCLTGGDAPFVRALASSGVPCLGYTIDPEEELGHSIVECTNLCPGDFPKPEEAWGARMGILLTQPDAIILVGASEGFEGTLAHLSPILVHNKGREHPKPFVLVNWEVNDDGHIRALFGIPASTREGGVLHAVNECFTCVPRYLDTDRSVRLTLQALGLVEQLAPTKPLS